MTARAQWGVILLMCVAFFPGCLGTQNGVGGSEQSILRNVEKLFDAAHTIDIHGYYVMAGNRVGIDRTNAKAEDVRTILIQALRSQERQVVLDSMKVLTTAPVALHAGHLVVYFKSGRTDQRIEKLEIFDWGMLAITGYDKSVRIWNLRGEPMEFMNLFYQLSRKA